jgi:hypothetical protein
MDFSTCRKLLVRQVYCCRAKYLKTKELCIEILESITYGRLERFLRAREHFFGLRKGAESAIRRRLGADKVLIFEDSKLIDGHLRPE